MGLILGSRVCGVQYTTYLKGFYEGVMTVWPCYRIIRIYVKVPLCFAVQDAKPLVRAAMLAEGTAAAYSEPVCLAFYNFDIQHMVL